MRSNSSCIGNLPVVRSRAGEAARVLPRGRRVVNALRRLPPVITPATPTRFVVTLVTGASAYVDAESLRGLWASIERNGGVYAVDGKPVRAALVRNVRPATASERRA